MNARAGRAIVAVLAGAAAAAVLAPQAASAATLTHTVRTVVRPVTTTGHVAPGFHRVLESGGEVDCSFASPSPAGVNRNIESCSPSAEYAVACWHAASRHYALCFRNAHSHRVYKIHLASTFARTPRSTDRAPLLMKLADGVHCSLRSGGAGPSLPTHPNLFATYYCSDGTAVWASDHSRHLGINETHPVWRVRVARDGDSTLVRRRVAHAWFVGTAQP